MLKDKIANYGFNIVKGINVAYTTVLIIAYTKPPKPHRFLYDNPLQASFFNFGFLTTDKYKKIFKEMFSLNNVLTMLLSFIIAILIRVALVYYEHKLLIQSDVLYCMSTATCILNARFIKLYIDNMDFNNSTFVRLFSWIRKNFYNISNAIVPKTSLIYKSAVNTLYEIWNGSETIINNKNNMLPCYKYPVDKHDNIKDTTTGVKLTTKDLNKIISKMDFSASTVNSESINANVGEDTNNDTTHKTPQGELEDINKAIALNQGIYSASNKRYDYISSILSSFDVTDKNKKAGNLPKPVKESIYSVYQGTRPSDRNRLNPRKPYGLRSLRCHILWLDLNRLRLIEKEKSNIALSIINNCKQQLPK